MKKIRFLLQLFVFKHFKEKLGLVLFSILLLSGNYSVAQNNDAPKVSPDKYILTHFQGGKKVEKETKSYKVSATNLRAANLDNTFFNYEVYEMSTVFALKTDLENRNFKKQRLSFFLELENRAPINFTIAPANIFGENFQFHELTENGSRVIPFDTDIAFKGMVNGDPNQRVRITITDDIFYAWYQLDGEEYFIEPLWYLDQNADRTTHVLYNKKDVKPMPELSCGNDEVQDRADKINPAHDSGRMMVNCSITEFALAGAFDMVGKYGGTAEVGVKMTGVTNNMNALYVPLNIEHTIVDIVVPATEAADPWFAGPCMDDLLPSFVSWAPGGFVTHDLGQLWVNRDVTRDDMNGCTTTGLIGRAAGIGTVCTDDRYNCCEDWVSNNAAAQAHLSAHENGHDWDGTHGSSVGNTIMIPSLDSGNPATTFSAANSAQIIAHRDSRQCLNIDDCCMLTVDCALITDQTFSCRTDIPDVDLNLPIVIESCGDVIVSVLTTIPGDTGCPGDPISITRTYTILDDFGNMEECMQTFTIESNNGPTITCPPTMVVECIADFTADADDATGTAECPGEFPMLTVVASGPSLDIGSIADCNGATYTVTYTATDFCGRMASCDQQIAVVNDPPTIVCPANAVIECEDEIMPAMDDVMVMTSCDVNSTVTFSDPVMIGQANCNLTVYQVTYTATDVCGRQATCTQSLTIENEGPSITIPADMTLACDEPTDPGEGGGVAVASYTGEPQGWPDNGDGSTGLVATLTADVSGVPAGAVITDVNVKLVADHSWVGDLELEMLSPDGTTVELLADVTCPASGNSDNVDVTFDDEGAPFSCSVVTSDTGTPDDCSNDYLGGAALSGTVQPQLGTLGDFDGEDPNGTWTLAVSDDTGGDGGCFSEFEVIVSYAIPGDGTGTATAIASCNLEVEVTFEDEVDVTVCEGGTILRTWTATDDCGREVSEVQTLTILPALAPVITSCPGPQTVECPEDIVTTPEAVVATLDCGVTAETTVAGPVIDGPEACPGTTYTYTYTVTDECGRIDQCEQVFTIGENDAPTIDVVPTITVDCFESINPDPNLADVTTACGNGVDFEVTVTDPVLGNGLNCPGETYSVTYTITDACGRMANATQTFVIANDGPTMECPDNCEVLTCYDGDYNAIIEAWINTVEATSSCSVDLNVTNNYFGVNGICVGDFTPVTFSATDACGRSVSCESGIYIIDTDAPDIYQAPEDLLIPCTANTEQIFSDWLADYGGAEAVDACGGEVFWSADTGVNALNCANGPQAIVVTFTVTDGCGNSASVVGTFNTKLLPDAVNVAGLIQTEAAEAVASVEVAAYQSEGMTEMDMSDDNGDYNFEELPYEENTEIVPAKNDDYLNGVTTYDLILLQQHILGINTLNSPYKQIAADANRSGSISTLDLVLLRRLILHVDEELADNTSWRFVDADFVFPNPANAFESDFPEVYTLSGIEEELKDFVAVKIGDLNLDAEANSFHQSDDRSALADLEMLAEDQKLKAGQEYEVSLNAENFASINGFQFTLNFDQSAIEILDIESADLANFDSKNYGMSKVEQGAVTISWHSNTAQDLAKQDAVFTVVLRAESATQLSEVLSISSAYTKAEAYQGSELMNVSLNFSDNGGLVTAQSLKLYQNQPNPFKDATMIGFDLPKAGAVDFMIYDLTGKLVYRAQGEFAAGYNQIEVDRSDLPNGGVFYYHINTDEDAASKKMIIID